MTRIITPAALQGRSLTELEALYRAVEQELVQAELDSQARREAVASLDAISVAIARRSACRLNETAIAV